MEFRAVLAVLLMFIATAKAAEGNIEFWRETVTLTCPKEGKWIMLGEIPNKNNTAEYMMKYDGKKNGVHYCEYTEGEEKKKYYFYMKGRVCENCFEMDAVVFLLVIVVDIIGTAFVMMVIYKCTKRKSSAGSKSSYKTPSRSGGPAPPTPSRDYETLNPHTRTQDTYSSVNRTG